MLKDLAVDPLAEYRRINVAGNLNLARQTARARVRRFVFISSIGVNGGETFGIHLSSEDRYSPESPYALPIFEAETGLHEIWEEIGL